MLGIGVSALLSSGAKAADAQGTSVVSGPEREIRPRSAAISPGPGSYSVARREAGGGPTVVGVGIFFPAVAALGEVEQTLDADIYLFVRWRGSRLASTGRGEGSADCSVP